MTNFKHMLSTIVATTILASSISSYAQAPQQNDEEDFLIKGRVALHSLSFLLGSKLIAEHGNPLKRTITTAMGIIFVYIGAKPFYQTAGFSKPTENPFEPTAVLNQLEEAGRRVGAIGQSIYQQIKNQRTEK